MTHKTNAVSIKILNKEYRINCPTGEEESLIKSANYVEEKMREVRTSGKIVSLDRLAIMAALNIAHELVSLQEQLENTVTNPTEQATQINHHEQKTENKEKTGKPNINHTDQQKLHHIQTLINKKLTEYRGQFEEK